MGNADTPARTAPCPVGMRAEIIRAIAADALFSEDPEPILIGLRHVVLVRVRQVLERVTIEEMYRACRDDISMRRDFDMEEPADGHNEN